jgi:Ala-tRNA(Pro) deacylase
MASAAATTPQEEAAEDPATSRRVLELLQRGGAAFRTLEHGPTRTSEESARVRGVALESGAKAMLMKAPKALAHGGRYVLAVMSAARTAEWALLRKALGTAKLNMATTEEVRAITGCVPGAVPPFGSLFDTAAAGGPVRTVLDASVRAQGPVINFNAGLRTLSVIALPVEDYLRLEQPTELEFTVPPARSPQPPSEAPDCAPATANAVAESTPVP